MLFKYDLDGGQEMVVESRNLLQNFCIASTEFFLHAIRGRALPDQLENKMARQNIDDMLRGLLD